MRVMHITAFPMTVKVIDIDDVLEAYQGLVDGYIEVVYAKGLRRYAAAMVVNEEGVLNDLPCNPVASVLYGDYIAGDVVIVGVAGPDFTDVPFEVIEGIYEMCGGEQND